MKKKSPNEKARSWQARKSRVRSSLDGTDRTRLTVYRSGKHIYAQLVDSESGSTIASVSTRTQGLVPAGEGTGNVAAAKRVGAEIAKQAQAKDVGRVVFNRNGFLFHGRVKALADAAREAGLDF